MLTMQSAPAISTKLCHAVVGTYVLLPEPLSHATLFACFGLVCDRVKQLAAAQQAAEAPITEQQTAEQQVAEQQAAGVGGQLTANARQAWRKLPALLAFLSLCKEVREKARSKWKEFFSVVLRRVKPTALVMLAVGRFKRLGAARASSGGVPSGSLGMHKAQKSGGSWRRATQLLECEPLPPHLQGPLRRDQYLTEEDYRYEAAAPHYSATHSARAGVPHAAAHTARAGDTSPRGMQYKPRALA